MMKNVIDKKLCTGCGACFSTCSNGSITMIRDEEGFLYPIISDTCIHCGKCLSVCPRVNIKKIKNEYVQTAYAAVTKNKKVWKRSASGGAFSEICASWDDGDTLFCGAVWDGLSVKHICILGSKNISPICKSKYIASDIGDTYKIIKDYLEIGKKALFSGTPCQVAGLKAFLGKEYDNLLLVDLICHGVGSQAVFSACIQMMEKDFEKKITSYEFRSKKKVYERDHLTKITFENGRDFKYITEDRYMQLFVKQNCLRQACGSNCIYRNQNRQGDITIGDFKGIKYVFPKLIGKKQNYSTIVFNSFKGESLLKDLGKRMRIYKCDIEDIKKYNPLFYKHTFYSEDREAFYTFFLSNPEKAINEWTIPSRKYSKSLKSKIFDNLPVIIRRILKRGK